MASAWRWHVSDTRFAGPHRKGCTCPALRCALARHFDDSLVTYRDEPCDAFEDAKLEGVSGVCVRCGFTHGPTADPQRVARDRAITAASRDLVGTLDRLTPPRRPDIPADLLGAFDFEVTNI